MSIQDSATQFGSNLVQNAPSGGQNLDPRALLGTLLGMGGSIGTMAMGGPSSPAGKAMSYMVDAADKTLKTFFSSQSEKALTEPGGMESLLSHASMKDQLNGADGSQALAALLARQGNGPAPQNQQIPGMAQPAMVPEITVSQNTPNNQGGGFNFGNLGAGLMMGGMGFQGKNPMEIMTGLMASKLAQQKLAGEEPIQPEKQAELKASGYAAQVELLNKELERIKSEEDSAKTYVEQKLKTVPMGGTAGGAGKLMNEFKNKMNALSEQRGTINEAMFNMFGKHPNLQVENNPYSNAPKGAVYHSRSQNKYYDSKGNEVK